MARLFAELGERQAAGTLWVVGLPEAADHLRAASTVHVDHLDGYTLSVEQRGGPVPLRGLTVLVPDDLGWPSLDGTPASRQQVLPHPDGLLVVLDTEPGQPIALRFHDPEGWPVLLHAGVTVHPPQESP